MLKAVTVSGDRWGNLEAERLAIESMQAAALPSALPELPGLRVAAVYQPADPNRPVGGDWYDVFALASDRVSLVIADVAGHGRGAAAFMVDVRNLLRRLALDHPEPGEVLRYVNESARRLNVADGPFVICCYAVLDVSQRLLRWAQAGHFSPLIVRRDGSTTYPAERPGPPLALFDVPMYESSATRVEAGDRVVMFTDGLVERRREHLDIGLERLSRVAGDQAHLGVDDFVLALAASVRQPFDDLAVLCVEVSLDS